MFILNIFENMHLKIMENEIMLLSFMKIYTFCQFFKANNS